MLVKELRQPYLEGWFLRGMAWYERIVCAVGGLLLIYPGLVTDLVGVALVAAVLALQLVKRSKTSTVKA